MARLLRRVMMSAALCGGLALVPQYGQAQDAPSPAPSAKEAAPSEQPAPTKEELAAARQLFTEALALEQQDDWSGALEKFTKVGGIKMTPQVRFHIALCHENLGRWVDAINGFELAAQEAARAGSKAASVRDNAPVRAEALRGKVAHLTLTLKGRRTISKVLLDGNPISDVLFGSNIPVDPGEHRIEVRRNDEVTFEETLTFEEAQSQSLELEIDDPEVVPVPVPSTGSGGAAVEPEGEEVRIPAYVIGGLGIVGLATAGAMFGIRESNLQSIADNCDDPDNFVGCNKDDERLVDQAFRLDIASKVMFGVGGAALATGVVLFFAMAPEDAPAAEPGADGEKPAEPEVTLQVLPLATPTFGGIGFVGTF